MLYITIFFYIYCPVVYSNFYRKTLYNFRIRTTATISDLEALMATACRATEDRAAEKRAAVDRAAEQENYYIRECTTWTPFGNPWTKVPATT